MTTIHNAYINALLADATYALDDKITNGLTSGDLTEVLDERMTPCSCQLYQQRVLTSICSFYARSIGRRLNDTQF